MCAEKGKFEKEFAEIFKSIDNLSKRMRDEYHAIEKVYCMRDNNEFTFVGEVKDIYNSDFYESVYWCQVCGVVIKIRTHEWRD